MKTSEEVFSILKEKFQDSIIELKTDLPIEQIITVNPSKLKEVCLFLRDEKEFEFDSLMCLSGVDEADGEKITNEQGVEFIKGGRLSVYYHLFSTSIKHKITLKAYTDRNEPIIASVESVWKTANWHERETYDMFGIKFSEHPELSRILMPYDWEAGFPLRKDYKNPEFYQGIRVPY